MNERYGYQYVFGVTTTRVLGGLVGQIVFADEVIWQTDVYGEDLPEPQKTVYDEASHQLKTKIKELFQ